MALKSKVLDNSIIKFKTESHGVESRVSRAMMVYQSKSLNTITDRETGRQDDRAIERLTIHNTIDSRPNPTNSRQKVLNCYYPGDKFPTISITGNECALNCKHCGHHYLTNMHVAKRPEQLKLLCENLARKGANGILISGGCDANGAVPLGNFIETISAIKSETNLIINVHTGLIDDIRTAQALAEAGVDGVSVDIVADTATIHEIYGLAKTPEHYRQTLKLLFEAGVTNIVPHICIGLHYGKLRGEFKAIEMLNDLRSKNLCNPSAIVFIVFIPTQSTALQDISPPAITDVTNVLKQARSTFADTSILLGCMRPKTTQEERMLELESIKLGVNGIVLPSRNTIEYAKSKGYTINNYETCCAII